MYLSFYGLKKKPFQLSTNSSFIWLGKMHKEALTLFKYGIVENKGFLLLTGDIGTGKTTLANALIKSLGDEVVVAKVPDPGMESLDFMNYISSALEMGKKFISKEAFLVDFHNFLDTVCASGKKVLLVIDECQRLNSDQLEEIRQLSNLEHQERKLLNIFLIGQSGFNQTLQEECNRPLLQRISINYSVKPLDINETEEFIRHRLTIAGAQDALFNLEVIKNIYQYSGGIPRRINIISDHLLLSGFISKTRTLTGEMVASCADDLSLPDFSTSETIKSLQTADSLKSKNDLKAVAGSDRGVDGLQPKSTTGKKTFGTILLLATVAFVFFYLDLFTSVRHLYYRVIDNGMHNGVQVQAVFKEPFIPVAPEMPRSDEFIEVYLHNSTNESPELQAQHYSPPFLEEKSPGVPAPAGLREQAGEKDFLEKTVVKPVEPVEIELLAEPPIASKQQPGFADQHQEREAGQLDKGSGYVSVSTELPRPAPAEPEIIVEELEIIQKRQVTEVAIEEIEGVVPDAELVVEPVAETEETTVSDTINTTLSEDKESKLEKIFLPEGDAQAYSKRKEQFVAESTNDSSHQNYEMIEEYEDEESEDLDPGAIIDWLLKSKNRAD